jgi:hypothetical protein
MILLGCTTAPAPVKAPPVVAEIAAPVVPASDAGAKEPAVSRESGPGPGEGVVGRFEWPPRGTTAVLGAGGTSKVFWSSPAGTGNVALPREAARAVLRDVDGDGVSELVVFAKQPAATPEWFEDVAMTWILGVAPSGKPARMTSLEYQVLGATDEASFERELRGLSTLGDPSTMPLPKIVVRLGKATPQEMRALVGPKGLKLCQRRAERRSCVPIAQRSIDARRSAEIAQRGGTFARFACDDCEEALQPPACQPDEEHRDRVRCGADVGGPAGGEWIFEKSGDRFRLAEVGSWAEDS